MKKLIVLCSIYAVFYFGIVTCASAQIQPMASDDCPNRFKFEIVNKTLYYNSQHDDGGCNLVPIPPQGVGLTDNPIGTVPASPSFDMCYIDPTTSQWTNCRNAYTEPVYLGRLFDALKNQLGAKTITNFAKVNQSLLSKVAIEETFLNAAYYMWPQQNWVSIMNNASARQQVINDFTNYYNFVSTNKWVYMVTITGEVLSNLCAYSGAPPACNHNAQGAAFIDLTKLMVASAKASVAGNEKRFVSLQFAGHDNLGITAMKTDDTNLQHIDFIAINTFPGPSLIEWTGGNFLNNFRNKSNKMAFFQEIGADSYLGWISQPTMPVPTEGYEDIGVQAFIHQKQCEFMKEAMDDDISPIIRGPQFYANLVDHWGWSAFLGSNLQSAWVHEPFAIMIGGFPWQISGPDNIGSLEHMGLFKSQIDPNNRYAPNTVPPKDETVNAINSCWSNW